MKSYVCQSCGKAVTLSDTYCPHCRSIFADQVIGYTSNGYDYKKQAQEVAKLCKSLSSKAVKFIKTTKQPWAEDLLSVIKTLNELNKTLK